MATILAPKNKLLIDAGNTQFPSQMQIVQNDKFETSGQDSYYIGYVGDGDCRIKYFGLEARLSAGMYFALSCNFKLEATGTVALFKRIGYRGLNSIGGPLEATGRQRYIDGCTSTLLIYPALLGDCCFNYLYFPPNTVQTSHFHPSIRLGVVTEGSGYCHVNGTKMKLKKADCFYLEENEEHYFSSENEALAVVAYHPDSDWGPTHEVHPMINRTFFKPS